MTTLTDIKNIVWFGNYHNDSESFDLIHEFVMDDNNRYAERAEALRIMSDKGMGEGRDEHLNDMEMVSGYVLFV